MKYDLSKKPTKGAMRTLDAFSKTMFEILSNKSFDDITVNELCEKCNFPRATFYNYFDDKYDLMNYCWYSLSRMIYLEEYVNLDPEESLYIFFDRIYDLTITYQDMVRDILNNNPVESFLFNNFRVYMNTQMRDIFRQCKYKDRYKIPYEIVSDHYSNTILLILEWQFLKANGFSKAKAHDYLKYLLEIL